LLVIERMRVMSFIVLATLVHGSAIWMPETAVEMALVGPRCGARLGIEGFHLAGSPA